jgi:hypothetical protein
MYVGMHAPVKLHGERYGILTQQPYKVFAIVEHHVMAEESLTAANDCASQYF